MGKGQANTSHVQQITRVHLKHREREEMGPERMAGVTPKSELYPGICGRPQGGAEFSRLLCLGLGLRSLAQD